MRHFIFDRFAAVWRPDGLCELFIADVATIDRLRTHDLMHVGLPAETMRALWREAQRIVVRADLTGVRELTESPWLLWLNGQTGAVIARWEAQEPWSSVLAKLREVDRAA